MLEMFLLNHCFLLFFCNFYFRYIFLMILATLVYYTNVEFMHVVRTATHTVYH